MESEQKTEKSADLLRTEIFTLNSKIDSLIADFINKNGNVTDLTIGLYRGENGYHVSVEVKIY